MRRKNSSDVLAALSQPITAGQGPKPEAAPVAPAPLPAPAAPARDRVKLTVYLESTVHERLREIAFRTRRTQNEIILRALDDHLASLGHSERSFPDGETD